MAVFTSGLQSILEYGLHLYSEISPQRCWFREPSREPGTNPGANPRAGPKPGSQPGSQAKTREPTREPGPNPGANPPLKFCVAYVAVATASRGLSSNVHCKTHRNCNSTQLQIHCHCHTDLNVTVPQATRASSLFTLIWGLQGSRSRVCNIDSLS